MNIYMQEKKKKQLVPMPHTVHKNQLKRDHIPKHKTKQKL